LVLLVTFAGSVWSLGVIHPADCLVALVTAPDLETARRIAQAALNSKAAACANLLPQIESHYWWQGKLEQNAEVLIIFKTTEPKRAALQEVVLANHPYETPEFVVLPITQGSGNYLAWIRNSVAG
jgi:periplasmic divalent cation tolerance protein